MVVLPQHPHQHHFEGDVQSQNMELEVDKGEFQVCQGEKGPSQCQLPKRFIVTILGFLGMFNLFAMRMNLTVAIVAMVNKNSSFLENNTLLYGECPAENRRFEGISDFGSQAERFNWDSVIQSQVIGSFYYAYFITVFLGGYLAARFGGHIVFGAGIFISSILTLLTPVSAQWGLIPLLITRALVGLSQGPGLPSITSVISKWAPKMERSRMHSVIFSGTLIGNVVTYSVSGWLCSTDFLGGWPSAFYVFGILGCIWYLFWCIFVYESPFKHPSITADEFALFKDNMNVSKKHLRVPWLSIISSMPFLVVVLTFMGVFFADTIIFAELPTYLHSVHHVDVQSVGIYSALLSIALCVGSWLASYVADKLRQNDILKITNIRKICNSIAGYTLALSLISIPFCECKTWLVIVIFSFGMFVNGWKCSGFQVISLDMSPAYSGILFGIANGLGSLMGVAAPTMVGAFTESGATVTNWSKVFSVTAAVSALTTTVFALFSSAELQPWGKPNSAKESVEILKLKQKNKLCINLVD